MSVDRMLRDGLLERVEIDRDGAGSALEEALRHVDSARTIRLTDPNGAYQLAYDGARKAVMSHMRRSGIRVRRGEGAHAIVASYAAVAIDEGLGRRLDGMRRRRNRSEYGSAYFNDDDVQDAAAVAASLIAAVSTEQ